MSLSLPWTKMEHLYYVYCRDQAVMDDEAYVRISGRIKDMIIRGGENIYPLEIEQVLYTHPKVKEVQVSPLLSSLER